jgi:hypothetical protein
MNFRKWFKKGETRQEQPSEAEARFKEALSLIDAGNEPEALFHFSRVLQFIPDHEQALIWREKLVTELGLEELDRAARVMEHFAYSHCGPGYGWKVEMRKMYSFRPHQPHETHDAAILDLGQEPHASIVLTTTGTQYTVKIMVAKPLPGVSRVCLSEVKVASIPAAEESLMELLRQFLSANTLVVRDRQLRYAGSS